LVAAVVDHLLPQVQPQQDLVGLAVVELDLPQ